MKRGQVTLFIILGIVLVAVTGLVFLYKDQLSQSLVKAGMLKKGALDLQAEEVTQKVNGCLETITGDAVLHVASNGGYVLAPKEGFAYYSVNSQLTAPEISKVESSISEYVEQMMPTCVIGQDFKANVEPKGTAKSSAKVSDENIKVTASYPLAVTLDQSSTVVREFNAESNARLGLLYLTALQTVKNNIGPNGLCLTCLFKEGIQKELKIDVYNSAGTGDTFFVISDRKTQVNNKPLVLMFAAKAGATA